jgi:hypothetical protein
MRQIYIERDAGVVTNWQLDPRLQAGCVVLLVASDIAPRFEQVSTRGKPRMDYARTYNVIPQDATEERAVEIFRQAWRAGRQTCGGSFDDAGIGDLSVRQAVLHDVPESRRLALTAWFEVHYPGVVVVFT